MFEEAFVVKHQMRRKHSDDKRTNTTTDGKRIVCIALINAAMQRNNLILNNKANFSECFYFSLLCSYGSFNYLTMVFIHQFINNLRGDNNFEEQREQRNNMH